MNLQDFIPQPGDRHADNSSYFMAVTPRRKERWESVFAILNIISFITIHSILYFTLDNMFRFKKAHLKISRGKAG